MLTRLVRGCPGLEQSLIRNVMGETTGRDSEERHMALVLLDDSLWDATVSAAWPPRPDPRPGPEW